MANVGSGPAGQTLIGDGNGAGPKYAPIGTNSGLTIHGVVLAQANGAFIATSSGNTGQVLVSNGAGADPTFQSGGAIFANTITGNSGGAISPSSGNWNIVTANSTIQFVGSGSTLTHDFGNTNLCLGSSLPMRTSSAQNVIIGNLTGANITSALSNVIIGYQAGSALTSGASNILLGLQAAHLATTMTQSIAIGTSALLASTAGIAANNIAIGHGSLAFDSTGTNNIGIGVSAGSNYTTSESSNIVIANSGVAAESNAIRIGTQGSGSGQQNSCAIAGITGVTVSNPVLTTINSSTGQLGVQALTQYNLMIGGASNAVAFIAPSTAGQVLQSAGASANPTYSTATYPSTATSAGKILVADGTNWVASTPTFPNASASAGKFIRSDGTNWIASTPTMPTTAGTSGKILVSDGTNFVSSTPTFPNASASSGKFIRSDGTNWIASTPTMPTTAGTSGNVLTSDGTNFLSSTPPTLAANALVSLNTTISNVTGDNTFYGPIIFNTVAFDTGSNYNATTGLFTAPTTGKYLCCCSCSLQNLGAAHTSGEFRLLIAGSTYTRSSFSPYIMSSGGIFTYTFSLVVPVTAAQTISFGAVVAGSTKTVGIQGNSFGNYSFASFTFLG